MLCVPAAAPVQIQAPYSPPPLDVFQATWSTTLVSVQLSSVMPAFTTAGHEQSTHLLAIQWRRWTTASATGVGEIPIIEEHIPTGEQREGRERVTILHDLVSDRVRVGEEEAGLDPDDRHTGGGGRLGMTPQVAEPFRGRRANLLVPPLWAEARGH